MRAKAPPRTPCPTHTRARARRQLAPCDRNSRALRAPSCSLARAQPSRSVSRPPTWPPRAPTTFRWSSRPACCGCTWAVGSRTSRPHRATPSPSSCASTARRARSKAVACESVSRKRREAAPHGAPRAPHRRMPSVSRLGAAAVERKCTRRVREMIVR
eukprot:2389684-Prymnesium_polylepis.1